MRAAHHGRPALLPATLGAAAAILACGCGGQGEGGGATPLVAAAPTADLAAGATLVKAGVALEFSLSVNGMTPATYAWDFGDGEGAEGADLASASHAFAAEGTYVVTATATDARGGSVGASVTIEVTPAGGAPVLTVESVELRAAVSDGTLCEVTVNGSLAADVGGDEFTWQDGLDGSPEVYEVRALDEGGNATTQTVTVTFIE